MWCKQVRSGIGLHFALQIYRFHFLFGQTLCDRCVKGGFWRINSYWSSRLFFISYSRRKSVKYAAIEIIFAVIRGKFGGIASFIRSSRLRLSPNRQGSERLEFAVCKKAEPLIVDFDIETEVGMF